MAALERVESSPEVQRLIAAMDQAPLVNPSMWSGFQSTNGLYTPDEVVQKRGWEIYDTMRRRDGRISTCLAFLKLALVSGGSEIVPGDDTPEAEKRAESMRWNIEKGFRGSWSKVPHQMLAAIHDGVSINEKRHAIAEDGPNKGLVYLADFRDKHPQHFKFDQDVFGNLLPDGLVQFKDEGTSEKRLRTSDFVIYSHESRFGNLYGQSMLQPAYEAFFCRQVLPRQINVGIEKAGMGGLVVTVPKGTTPEQMAAVLARARLMHGAAVYVKIEGETWEPVPFEGKGIDAGLKALERYDNELAFALTFPPLFWNANASAGSFGRSEIDLEIAIIIWSSLQTIIDEAITEQILYAIDAANFGPGPCPKHKLKPINVGGVKALFAKWEAMDKAGVTPTIETIARETGYAVDDLEDKPEPVSPFGAGPPGEEGALPKRRARVGDGEDKGEQFSERFRTGPEARVNLSEIAAAHDGNASKGRSALREAIRLETERLQDALRKESDVARGPLAERQSTASSARTPKAYGGSRPR